MPSIAVIHQPMAPGVSTRPVQVKAAGRSIAPTAAPQRPSRCGEAVVKLGGLGYQTGTKTGVI